MNPFFGKIMISRGFIRYSKSFTFNCNAYINFVNFSSFYFIFENRFPAMWQLFFVKYHSHKNSFFKSGDLLRKCYSVKFLKVNFCIANNVDPLYVNFLPLSEKTIENESHAALSSKKYLFKVALFAHAGIPLSMAMPLIKLSNVTLHKALKWSKEDKLISGFPNHIAYMCYHLKLSPAEAVNLLSIHSHMLSIKFKRLDRKLTILKAADISVEDIVKDLWIFRYNEDSFAKRILKLQKIGVSIKPWMLRRTEKQFSVLIARLEERNNLLNGKDMAHYLALKLNCSEEYVKLLMENNKLLNAINVGKLNQLINFLYEKGYTAEELRLFPRIFSSSVKTLKKRFEEFYKKKGNMPALSQLCFISRTSKL